MGHFSEFATQAKSKVGRGCNVGVDDGDNVSVGVDVAVGGAFQQNFAPLHGSLGVGVGEIVGVEVSWGFKQGSAELQLSGGGGGFVLVGVFGFSSLDGLFGVRLRWVVGSSGSHSTP